MQACIVATRCERLVDEAVTAACSASPALTSLMLALCTSLHSPRIHGLLLTEVCGRHRVRLQSSLPGSERGCNRTLRTCERLHSLPVHAIR